MATPLWIHQHPSTQPTATAERSPRRTNAIADKGSADGGLGACAGLMILIIVVLLVPLFLGELLPNRRHRRRRLGSTIRRVDPEAIDKPTRRTTADQDDKVEGEPTHR